MDQEVSKKLEHLLLEMLPSDQYATPIGRLYELLGEQAMNFKDIGLERERVEDLYYGEIEVIVKLIIYNLEHITSDHRGLRTLRELLNERIPCLRERGADIPTDGEVEKILKEAYRRTALYYINCLDSYEVEDRLTIGSVGRLRILDLKNALSDGNLSFEDVDLTKEKYNLFLAKELIELIWLYKHYYRCETPAQFFSSIENLMKSNFGVNMKEALKIIGITKKDLVEFFEEGAKGNTIKIFRQKLSE